MSGSQKYWAEALSMSPGASLAKMQERMYASETIDGLMAKFDRKVTTMAAGIVDPNELQAAQMQAQTLLAEKQALARGSGRCRHLSPITGVKPPLPLLRCAPQPKAVCL